VEGIKNQTPEKATIYLYKYKLERRLGNCPPQICMENVVTLLFHKLSVRSIMISFYSIWESFVID